MNYFIGNRYSFFFTPTSMKDSDDEYLKTISKAYLLVMAPQIVMLCLKTESGVKWWRPLRRKPQDEPLKFKRVHLNRFYLYSSTYYWSFATIQVIINCSI